MSLPCASLYFGAVRSQLLNFPILPSCLNFMFILSLFHNLSCWLVRLISCALPHASCSLSSDTTYFTLVCTVYEDIYSILKLWACTYKRKYKTFQMPRKIQTSKNQALVQVYYRSKPESVTCHLNLALTAQNTGKDSRSH